jgi:hypothetical protein
VRSRRARASVVEPDGDGHAVVPQLRAEWCEWFCDPVAWTGDPLRDAQRVSDVRQPLPFEAGAENQHGTVLWKYMTQNTLRLSWQYPFSERSPLMRVGCGAQQSTSLRTRPWQQRYQEPSVWTRMP